MKIQTHFVFISYFNLARGVFVEYQYSWAYPKTFDKESTTIIVRDFTHEILVGTTDCEGSELQCNNNYELQLGGESVICGLYKIYVEIEQLEYPDCFQFEGKNEDTFRCMLFITSITLSPLISLSESEADSIKFAVIKKLDEAFDNGCIESLLYQPHPSISPQISPPATDPISINYQYSVSYSNEKDKETIREALKIITEDIVQRAIACEESTLSCPGEMIGIDFVPSTVCGLYEFSLNIEQLVYPRCTSLSDYSKSESRICSLISVTANLDRLVETSVRQDKEIHRKIIEYFHEAVETGCIEAVLLS